LWLPTINFCSLAGATVVATELTVRAHNVMMGSDLYVFVLFVLGNGAQHVVP
jgi:hypothetical protein